jgi:hypothetical protein
MLRTSGIRCPGSGHRHIYGAEGLPGAGPPCRRPGNWAGGSTGSTRRPQRDRGFSTNMQARTRGPGDTGWTQIQGISSSGFPETERIMTEASNQDPSVHRPPQAPATAADVMRPAPATIESRGHVAAAAYLMKHAGMTALVVVDDQAKQPSASSPRRTSSRRWRTERTSTTSGSGPDNRASDRHQRGDKHPGRGQIHGDRAFPAPAGGRRNRPDRDGRHHRCLRRLARPAAGRSDGRAATGAPQAPTTTCRPTFPTSARPTSAVKTAAPCRQRDGSRRRRGIP